MKKINENGISDVKNQMIMLATELLSTLYSWSGNK
jgi:hypothetical protein